MNQDSILIGLSCLVVLCAILFVALKDRTAIYKQDVIYLENFLSRTVPTRANYEFILMGFDKLSRNNQDQVRTKKLWDAFISKYRDYWFDSATRKEETALIIKLQNRISAKKITQTKEEYYGYGK